MLNDTIITVENLGKKYRLGQRANERYVALRDVTTAQRCWRCPTARVAGQSCLKLMKQSIARLRRYVREALKISRTETSSQSFWQMLRLFPRWERSLDRTPLELALPWLTYAAINFLEGVLSQSTRAFEWGVGGSTLFFSSRVSELISVEHDAQWADSVCYVMNRVNRACRRPAARMLSSFSGTEN
jgi:hypothetical protein